MSPPRLSSALSLHHRETTRRDLFAYANKSRRTIRRLAARFRWFFIDGQAPLSFAQNRRPRDGFVRLSHHHNDGICSYMRTKIVDSDPALGKPAPAMWSVIRGARELLCLRGHRPIT